MSSKQESQVSRLLSPRPVLFLVLFSGFVLRLAFLFFLPPDTFLSPLRDQEIYFSLGTGIASGQGLVCPDIEPVDLKRLPPTQARRQIVDQAIQPGYFRGIVPLGEPTAFWLPVYPILVGMLLKVGVLNLLLIRLLQTVLAVGVILFLYQIARRLYGKEIALTASFLASVYPFFVYYTGLVMTETLYMFLLAASVASLLAYLDRRRTGQLLLLAILSGLTFLTRSVVLGLLVPILFLIVVTAKNRKQGFTHVLLYVAVIGLVLSPWAYRNYHLFGKLQILPTKGGPTFWARNNPLFLWQELEATSLSGINPADFEQEALLQFPVFTNETEQERSAIFFQRALDFIRANPVTYLKLCVLKCRWLLTPFGGITTPYWQRTVSLLCYGLTFILAVAALVMRREWSIPHLVLPLVLLYFIVFHSVVNGDTRFRIPLDMFFIVLASPLYYRILVWLVKVMRPHPTASSQP